MVTHTMEYGDLRAYSVSLSSWASISSLELPPTASFFIAGLIAGEFCARTGRKVTKQERSLPRRDPRLRRRRRLGTERPNLFRDLPERLEEFTEHLVDGEASASSSQAAGFQNHIVQCVYQKLVEGFTLYLHIPGKSEIPMYVCGPPFQGLLAESAPAATHRVGKTVLT